MTLLNKSCYATAAIKIESIFIGAKISLQVKVYEAEVKMFDTAPKRLLRKPQTTDAVVMSSSSSNSKNHDDDDMEEDDGADDDSVKGSDDEDDKPATAAVSVPVVQATAPVAKAPVRRVTRKP